MNDQGNIPTKRNIPKDYPNPFITNLLTRNNWDREAYQYRKPLITLIMWLRTPKGKLSKFYQYVTVKEKTIKDAYEKAHKRLKEAARNSYKKELNKGYTFDKVYVYNIQDPLGPF